MVEAEDTESFVIDELILVLPQLKILNGFESGSNAKFELRSLIADATSAADT